MTIQSQIIIELGPDKLTLHSTISNLSETPLFALQISLILSGVLVSYH